MQPEQFNQFNQTGQTTATVDIMPTSAMAGGAGFLSERPKISEPVSSEQNEIAQSTPRMAINRDNPRYIVMAGDLMPPSVKRSFRAFKDANLGGQWFSLTEIPCLWKFGGFVHRGRITPIIKRPEMARADEEIAKKKAAETTLAMQTDGIVRETPGVYRAAFPYDSMQSILTSHHGQQGFVEVEALEGTDWDLRVVDEIQRFFFPNWQALASGAELLPATLREFTRLIETKRRATDESLFESVADAFLESAEKFRIFAEAKVEESKRLAQRSVNDRGFSTQVSEFARFLATQIETDIEAPTVAQTVAAIGAQSPQPPAAAQTSAEELDIRKRELAIREEEIMLRKMELGLIPKPEIVSNAQAAQPNITTEKTTTVTETTEIVVEDAAKPKQKAK